MLEITNINVVVQMYFSHVIENRGPKMVWKVNCFLDLLLDEDSTWSDQQYPGIKWHHY